MEKVYIGKLDFRGLQTPVYIALIIQLLYNESTWKNGTMYEPLCWHFKYKNGVMSNPSGYLGY